MIYISLVALQGWLMLREIQILLISPSASVSKHLADKVSDLML